MDVVDQANSRVRQLAGVMAGFVMDYMLNGRGSTSHLVIYMVDKALDQLTLFEESALSYVGR